MRGIWYSNFYLMKVSYTVCGSFFMRAVAFSFFDNS